MKKYIFPLSIFFLAAFVLSLQSCSDIQANTETAATAPAKTEIPQLLPRTEGLGSVDERVQVNQTYDDNVLVLKQDPGNADARINLASLFIQEARVTGEHPYYYPNALGLLNPLLGRTDLNQEQQFYAHYLTASVQLSQHEFAKALEEGEKAQQIYPHLAAVYGVLIDAHVELGNYEKAVELSDKMVSMRPDLRSYSRISYLRELHGDPNGAIEAMEMAVGAGMAGYEQTAWCRVTLGELHETYGDLKAAEMHYEIALQERADFPFAYAGLASIYQQQGDLEKALEYLEKAIALIPEVGFYEQKANVLAEMGRVEESEALVPEILGMIQEDIEGGHIMDLELAAVQLDLAKDPDAALVAARKAEEKRPDNIEVQRMMAKIHAARGEDQIAKEYVSKARRIGWQAPDLLALAQ